VFPCSGGIVYPPPMLLHRVPVLFAVLALAACIPDVPTPGPLTPLSANSAAYAPGQLHRGINAGNALDAPKEGEWGVVLDERFFTDVAAAGFDHVRIPVRFNAHAGAGAPYTVDEDFFRRVDWAIEQTTSRKMTAILDFHHYVELMDDPDAHAARFVGIWKQIAARYHDRPATVLYELLNEPTSKITAPKWNALLVTALATVREVDPTRKVIVDSVFWAAAKELANLELPAGDTNLIASFHMYQPILFTHQGMPFMTAEYGTIGIPFPGPASAPIAPVPGALKVDWVADWFRRYNSTPAAENPGGPSAVLAEFAMARAFAERTKRPLYMGEFGTGDVIDIASRARWTRLVREEAERQGMGWAYWDDGGRFKVYDRKTGAWNPELTAALMR
jgi:endoglucanase